jgi:hypothetical protein
VTFDFILVFTFFQVLLANLGILALNIKLYTEIMKDKNQDRRSK